MRKYFYAQLMQVSAWIGIAVFVMAFVAPREYIAFLGVLLLLTDDNWLNGWVAKNAPGLKKWLEENTK